MQWTFENYRQDHAERARKASQQSAADRLRETRNTIPGRNRRRTRTNGER